MAQLCLSGLCAKAQSFSRTVCMTQIDVNSEHHSSFPLTDRRRFDAAIAYRGMSLRSFAALLGRWTPQHIAHVVAGERKGSSALYAAIRTGLGEPLWLFATGQTDSLRDEGGEHGAA